MAGSNVAPALEFELNPDILASVAKSAINSKKPYCVGFAAETNDLERHAAEKRVNKNIPMLVANLGPDTFGLDENELLVVEEKVQQRFARSNKLDLSRQLISLISTKI